MMTPDYASPEQVKGLPISTASDIYSLGAVLYELLTGQRPHRFTTDSLADMEQTICEVEPEKPSVAFAKHWQRQLSGDLDNIVLAAMRKEPQRRYASAAESLRGPPAAHGGLADPRAGGPLGLRRRQVYSPQPAGCGGGVAVVASLIGGIVTTTFQARRAERRFQEVRTLANAFLFEVHDQIETLPGSTKARESIVSTVLRYLNRLASESSGDPSLQWELATAYQKIGDVQGYTVRPNLGQTAAAMESQRKALEMAEQLAARGYDPKVQRLLALAHHRVGFILAGRQGEAGAGLEHYARALELLERLNRDSPGNPDYAPLLITIYGHQGDAELLRGRPAEAAKSWQRTLEIAEQWNSRNPTDAARLALGSAHRRVSGAAQVSGDLQKALEHARHAVALHEPLAASQPSSTALQRDLLNSYERLAFVAGEPDSLNLGDRATAFAYNSKVKAIAEALQEADPNNRMARTDLLLAKRSNCAFWPDDNAGARGRRVSGGVEHSRAL